MTNKQKIEALEKGIKSSVTPEPLKEKMRTQLAQLKALEKESTSDKKPKFKVGDVVVLKGETNLEKEITSYKQNSKGEFVYKAKYVSKPEATGEWNEEELELILQETAKPKVGDIITFVESSNVDAPTLKGTVEKINQLGLVVFIDGKQYEVRKLIDIKIVGKDKKIKPSSATPIKKATRNYYRNKEIKSVTVLENGKKVTYAGKDVLNGANFFKEGGVLTSKANYVPIRNIVEVTFEDGSKDKPRNGYHIKNGATPIMEHGGAVELPEGSLQHFENYYLEKGGKVGRLPKYVMDFQENDYKKMVQDYPDYPFYSVKNGTIQEIFSEKTEELVAKWNSKKKELTVYNPKYNSEVIVWLKENSFLTSDQVYEIDEMFEEEEYKLGGALLSAWKRERKYVNKSQDYETRYAKGKNRKGYSKFAKGGPIPQKGDFAKVPVGYGMYHYGLIKGIIKDDPTYPQNGYEIVGIGDVLHPEQFKVVSQSEFEKQKTKGNEVKTNSFLVIEEKLEKGGVLKVGDEVVDFDTMKHLGKVVEVSEINLDEDDIIVETPEGKTIKLNSFNVLKKPNVKANLGASPEVKLSIEELKAKHSVSNYGKGGKTDKEDPRGANFRLAKEIRQPGERWQDAVSRATKMLK